MAHFNDLPNEILEHIFDHLDFKSRRRLTTVCRRWNSVLFSKRFIDRKVFLAIMDNRMLYSKPSLRRKYSNVAVRLKGGFDKRFRDDIMEHLRAWLAVVPAPKCVRLIVDRIEDPRLVGILEKRLINLSAVETFYLYQTRIDVTTRGTSAPLQLQMDRLRMLHLDVFNIGNVRFSVPNLCELRFEMRSEEHLFFLQDYIDQLHSLSVRFSGPYNLNTFIQSYLRHLPIHFPQAEAYIVRTQSSPFGKLELSLPLILELFLQSTAEKPMNLVEAPHIPDLVIQHTARGQKFCWRILLKNRNNSILTLYRVERLQTLTLRKATLYTENGFNCLRQISNRNFFRLRNLVTLENVPKFIKLFPALRRLHICDGLHCGLDIASLKRTNPQLVISFEASTTHYVWDENTSILCTFSGLG